jgi:hypothetical protein
VLGAERAWYPYPVRSELGAASRKEVWRTLNLENEFLVCIVLPDLGGHLYSCRDKLSGYEMFHANPSIKKAMIGVRGAWAALGVELNFPVGHSLLTVSPVDFRTTQGADAASVWVGATDRVTGMRWWVEFTLERGSAALRQSVRVENPTAVRHRYYWWTNAGVTLGTDSRLVLPTRLIAGHGRAQIDRWPVGISGLDRSVPANFPTSAGWFAHESREPFLAVYNPRAQTGTLHYADPVEMPGKKIWVWGRDEDAQMRAALSDDNSQYVEIQAGLFPNQETYGFLGPGASRAFTEYWIPVRKIEGISQASRDGVVYLARNSGPLVAQFMPTRAIPGAKVQILCGGKALVDEAVAVDPSRLWTRSIAGAPAGPCRFQLQGESGKVLIEYTEGEIRAAADESVQLGAQPSSEPSPGSPESGAYFESQGDFRKASEELRKQLAKNPSNSEARQAAGRLAVVMQRFEEAAGLLSSAADAESHYYRGVALAGLGADEDAQREWSAARADAIIGVAAAVENAAAIARAGDVQRAGSELSGVGARSPRSLAMQAALARAAGDAAAAKSAVTLAASLDATDSVIRFEQVRQGASDPKLWEHLAADPERVLEIAALYMHWGRYKDALEALMYHYAPVSPARREPGAVTPQDYPMLAYYRGYCRQKLNEAFAEDFRSASALPVRYVFPHRAAERRILQAALQSNGGDANAHYLLGLWYLNAQLVAEGTRELQAAQKLRPELAEARALLASLKAPMAPVPAAVPPPAPKKAEAPKVEAPKPVTPTPSVPPPSSPIESSPLAGVPGWFSGKPQELVNNALDAAATGDVSRALTYFTHANFLDAKQADTVRWAYLEVHLQRVFESAYARKAEEAARGLAALGSEDKALPFTHGGFGAIMQTARFQFQLGLLDLACIDEKVARKRWEKVSRMKAPLTSPDFAYPYLALAKLGSTSELGRAVQQVDDAMPTASAADRPALIYSRGLLLWARGEKDQAAAAFREGASQAPPGMLRYLNQNALHVLTTR